MPTLEDLGKKVKAKYPGQYDDLADAEVGTRVKAKYPGSYDDFTGTAQPAEVDEGKQPATVGGTASVMAHQAGEFLGGAITDTVKGAVNTAKAILPKVSTGEGGAEAKAMIDKGDYLGAAKHLVARAVENTPGGGLITSAVHNAIDEAHKAKQAYEGGDTPTAARHAAAAIPVVGPVINGMAETGGADGQNNPARMLGQAAGLAAGPKVAEALPKIATTAGRAAEALAPDALRAASEKQYSQALGPTTKENKAIAARIVPELIDRGVKPLSLKSLQSTAQGNISSVGSAIGEAWDKLPPGTSTELAPVYQRLQDAIEKGHSVPNSEGKMIPKGPEAARAIQNIENLQQTLLDVSDTDPQTQQMRIPVDKIHSLKQYFDDIAARAGRYSGKDLADQSSAEAHGLAADAIRQELAKDHPDIAALNKEYSFWKNVDKVVGDTIMRRTGQAKPMSQQIAAAAGTAGGLAVGGVHGAVAMNKVMQAVEAVTTSTGWRTASAVAKDRLADAIADGNLGKVSFYARKITGSGPGASSPQRSIGTAAEE